MCLNNVSREVRYLFIDVITVEQMLELYVYVHTYVTICRVGGKKREECREEDLKAGNEFTHGRVCRLRCLTTQWITGIMHAAEYGLS